jgi:hypothetical protein
MARTREEELGLPPKDTAFVQYGGNATIGDLQESKLVEEEADLDKAGDTKPDAEIPIPKEVTVADEVPIGGLKPTNPPPPQPEFITKETTTQIPIYRDFEANIVDVINKTTVRVDKDFNQIAQKVGQQDGDYLGTDPREKTYFNVVYPHFTPDDGNVFVIANDDKEALVNNMQVDNVTVTDYPHSIVLKLNEPLNENVLTSDEIMIGSKVLSDVSESVVLIPPFEEEDYQVLRTPNIDDIQSPIRDRQTSYTTQNTLTTTDTKIRKNFEDTIISASLDSVELNVDYSKYTNFVNFSSAEQRLKNFKYKLEQIQTYTQESKSFTTVSASLGERNKWDRKIREVKQGFTGYEKYLFENSTTFTSGSAIQDTERFNSAWPKTGGSGTYSSPYINAHTTASVATTWYTAQIISASSYDTENRNSVNNLLPRFIDEDSANDDFKKFNNMIAEFYDELWLYVTHMSKISDRSEGLVDRNEGFPDDLTFDIAKGLGLKLTSNKDLIPLERWHLGQYLTGSTYVQYSEVPEKDIQSEIQKRVINNLPYLLKTKGTKRALEGIINCYGIPSTILRVEEYGGPDVVGKPQFLIKKRFTKALDFKGGQNVTVNWGQNPKSGRRPDTVEIRFAGKNSDSVSNNRVLLEGNDSGSNTFRWGVLLRDNGSVDSRGHIDFVLSGSNGYLSQSLLDMPVYDGDFISLMVNRVSSSGAQLADDSNSQKIKYTIYGKRYDSGRSKIFLEKSSSFTITGSSYNNSWTSGSNKLYIGGLANTTLVGAYQKYTGSLMEFRMWNTALSESKFDNHVAAPSTYNGNHFSASYTDLVVRYSFNDDKDLSSDTSILDISSDQSFAANGVASGFASNTFKSIEDEEKARVPNIGPNRPQSTKIRIESSKLVGNLNHQKKVEQSSFDLAPVDSNKVGIFFSPSDVINDDIIRSVADFNFDDLVGDPRDRYEYEYRGLKYVADQYWQKYTSPNNFWDYLRLIKYYDFAIFDLCNKFLPARANERFGLVIEPNLLERSKEVVGKTPSFDNLSFNGEINLTQYASENLFSASAEYRTYRGVIGYDTNHSASFGSDIFRLPTLYKLGVNDRSGNYGTLYLQASASVGGPNYVFEEGVQPFISGSRLSKHNQEHRFFYSSSVSASKNDFYSSSFVASEHDNNVDSYSNLANLFYEGCLQTAETTPDGFAPVETSDVKQTRLVVQEPGRSRLKTER